MRIRQLWGADFEANDQAFREVIAGRLPRGIMGKLFRVGLKRRAAFVAEAPKIPCARSSQR